jgi:hypothetical protein
MQAKFGTRMKNGAEHAYRARTVSYRQACCGALFLNPIRIDDVRSGDNFTRFGLPKPRATTRDRCYRLGDKKRLHFPPEYRLEPVREGKTPGTYAGKAPPSCRVTALLAAIAPVLYDRAPRPHPAGESLV